MMSYIVVLEWGESINMKPEEFLEGKELTGESRIEGVGVVQEYGELDLEKLVKRLLKSKYIIGEDE